MTAWDARVRQGLGALGGATLGASALAGGLYASALWRPVALGAFALTLALVVGARRAPAGLACVAIGALLGMWLWTALSVGWAESDSRAHTLANRWALYAALLCVCVLAVRDRATRTLALAAPTLAVGGVAIWILLDLATGGGADLFVRSRLNDPLGYVNAEGTYFLLAFWPLVALAESRRLGLAAAGAAGATALGSLVALTQSRGALLAFAVSVVVILAVTPGRRTRGWALIAIGVGMAVLAGPIADVYQEADDLTGAPPAQTLRDVGRLTLIVSAAVGAAWFAAGLLARALAARSSAARNGLARLSAAALAAIALAGVAVGVAARDRIGDRVSDQYHAFVDLAPQGSGTAHLLGGGGNRYDYWRIAWRDFRAEPLNGVGGGGYERRYFRERRTREDIRQPHSVLLQTLGELGAVGGVALLLFLGAVLRGLARSARLARRDMTERGLAVAAGGTFVAWLVHASVDWTWLFPGITGIALAAAAVLLCAGAAKPGLDATPDVDETPSRRRLPAVPRLAGAPARAAVIALTAALLAFATIATVRQMLSQHRRTQARALLVREPVRALARTSDALSLEPAEVSSYYIRAAAFARLGQYAPAREALRQALDREPHTWVTWALLGDLELRRGRLGEALRAYRRARALNPKDLGLAQAIADPRGTARALRAGQIRRR
jgi:hypothetical protein